MPRGLIGCIYDMETGKYSYITDEVELPETFESHQAIINLCDSYSEKENESKKRNTDNEGE